jgi:hypothetical protein
MTHAFVSAAFPISIWHRTWAPLNELYQTEQQVAESTGSLGPHFELETPGQPHTFNTRKGNRNPGLPYTLAEFSFLFFNGLGYGLNFGFVTCGSCISCVDCLQEDTGLQVQTRTSFVAISTSAFP